jgi:hypothetical protein
MVITMELQRFVADDQRPVRTIENDGYVVVADLGRGVQASVETLDETAIVVLPDDETMEIDLPSAPESAFITNGVLTIELEEER